MGILKSDQVTEQCWVTGHLIMAVIENGFFRDIIIPKLSLAQRGRYALRGSARQREDDVRTHQSLRNILLFF